jgi:ribosomal 30S subunit maturation factor RimM
MLQSMQLGDRFDTARLFGCEVLDGSGHRLGRVTAIVHRGDGCDVLVERRHWLRHRVVRIDLDDLAEHDGHSYRHVPSRRRSTEPATAG